MRNVFRCGQNTPGSAHDALVWKASVLHEELISGRLARLGEYLLGKFLLVKSVLLGTYFLLLGQQFPFKPNASSQHWQTGPFPLQFLQYVPIFFLCTQVTVGTLCNNNVRW